MTGPLKTGDYPGTPRWVKIIGLIVAVLVLIFVILQVSGITGDHGPGRHLSFDDRGVRTAPSRVAENYETSGHTVAYTRPQVDH